MLCARYATLLAFTVMLEISSSRGTTHTVENDYFRVGVTVDDNTLQGKVMDNGMSCFCDDCADTAHADAATPARRPCTRARMRLFSAPTPFLLWPTSRYSHLDKIRDG